MFMREIFTYQWLMETAHTPTHKEPYMMVNGSLISNMVMAKRRSLMGQFIKEISMKEQNMGLESKFLQTQVLIIKENGTMELCRDSDN